MLIFCKSLIHLFLSLCVLHLSEFSVAQHVLTADSAMSLALGNTSNEKPKKNKEIIARSQSSGAIRSGLIQREIYIEKEKTSFKFKYGGRFQMRFDLSRTREEGAKSQQELYFRRVRFKSDGHVFSPKLGYKLEIDVLNGQVLDAFLKWNFYRNFELWAGQTKLRGNRERVISSQNLQFVDRSLLNSKFTLDRDIGFWLMHHFKAGNGLIREAISISKGEGRSIFEDNPMPINQGLDYTARLEFLPLGNFLNKGDYSGSDLEREPTPKLSIGITYDYNDHAVRSQGHKGSVTDNEANLRSWIGDVMFKYRGFSFMAEYADRKVYGFRHQTVEQYNDFVNDFYTGTAFNAQSGYVFRKNYELAARYTQVRPQEGSAFNDLTEYTFALSKYIVGHSIKVQTDFSILHKQDQPVTHTYRLQFELSL